MGLDWFVGDYDDYNGPDYHRAKGLSWVLHEYGCENSSNTCYGDTDLDSQLPSLSIAGMETILKDCRLMIEEQKFTEEILDSTGGKTGLLGHLKEAEEMLSKVIECRENGNKDIRIHCD
jgi:hypothetical protein